MSFINQTCILAGSPTMPIGDEEGDDEGNYGNVNGNDRNSGYGTWDDIDEEED